MRPRLALLITVLGALLALPAVTAAQSGTTRYVNHAAGHPVCLT